MSRKQRPYLIIIRSGPVWKLEERTGFIARAFASEYEGELLTWATEPGDFRVDSFRVIRFPLPYEKPLLSRLRYMFRIWRRALRVRWSLRRRLVVISYDPFQSGMTALLIKWTTGCRFICEVNGVYGDPELLLDAEDGAAARRKRKLMLRLGSFVLRHSDHIKLLYPDQLAGFSVAQDRPERSSFPNLVDAGRFEQRERRPEHMILLVGAPFMLKGVDVLIRAFARLAMDFPNWELMIVGWQLEEPARSLEFPRERVHFPGPRPSSEVAELMARAGVFALPSRSEGMGRVLVEAAFAGCPRIGSRTGGIPSVIEDGVDGILVRPGDVADLTRDLGRLMADPELRERLGEAARLRARREFTENEYLRHYRRAISLAAHPPS